MNGLIIQSNMGLVNGTNRGEKSEKIASSLQQLFVNGK